MDQDLIPALLEYGPLTAIAFLMIWERQKMTALLGHQLESMTKIVESFEKYFKKHHGEHVEITKQLEELRRRLEDFAK